MADPRPSAPATGMKPWLRVVFGLSLAANLLIVGLVVGAVLRFGGPGAERPPLPTGLSMYRALPPEDRRALRGHVKKALPPSETRASEAKDLAAALSADPYDEAALIVLLDRHAADRARFQMALRQVWLTHVSDMSPDDRDAYAGRLIDLTDNRKRPKPARD
ncbi:MAG: periplasmic heavy metal sensor [Pseudomonadota bacterium]